jgi:hypothetical protein
MLGRGGDWVVWVLAHRVVCAAVVVVLVVWDVVTGCFEGADE